MYSAALLVLTAPLRSLNQHHIGKIFSAISKNVRNRLYVDFEPGRTTLWPPFKRSQSDWNAVSRFVPLAYDWATAFCRHLDVRVVLSPYKSSDDHSARKNFNFDVIFTDTADTESNVLKYVQKQFSTACFNIVRLGDGDYEPADALNGPQEKTYNTVVLGGTFDRLHNGHKILLSFAALRAKKKIIVGVTDKNMLKRKVLWELIEPVEDRIKVVKEFLEDIDPTIECSVIPIYDPFGPTIEVEDLDCIVVSEETKRGGDRVNAEREVRNMKPLDMVVIHLLEKPPMMIGDEEKLSSSDRRKELLGTYIKEPKVNSTCHTLQRIALVGDIQTGKSLLCKELERLGATVVDCNDILQSCLKENPNFVSKLLTVSREQMGDSQNHTDSCAVDIAILKEKSRREKVSSEILSLVKPAIERELQKIKEQGIKHVILKMPAFADDCWIADVHQIWGVITTDSEYKNQLKSCYNLSDAELEDAASNKLPESDVLRKSHLFFSHQGSDEFLIEQVQNAWNKLQRLTYETNATSRY